MNHAYHSASAASDPSWVPMKVPSKLLCGSVIHILLPSSAWFQSIYSFEEVVIIFYIL